MLFRSRIVRAIGGSSRSFMRPSVMLREKIRVTFITADEKTYNFEGSAGETIMEIGVRNNLDIEAACDGKCMCSTCHVYVDAAHFELLPPPSEDEEDMLDLALERDDTSRLSCQIKLTKAIDGITVTLPATTANVISSPP